MGIEQPAAERELGGAMAVGEEAEVADAMEAVRQDVQQEAADELVGVERHHLGLAVVAIVLPAEADLAVVEADQPAVGDGDAMGVAAEIGQHLLGPAEGRLGIDDPVDAAQSVEAGGEGVGLGKTGEIAEEAELAGVEGGLQVCRNSRRNRRESTRTGRKKPGRQAIQRVPSGERPPPGTTQWTWG